jgi:hypothetical protein
MSHDLFRVYRQAPTAVLTIRRISLIKRQTAETTARGGRARRLPPDTSRSLRNWCPAWVLLHVLGPAAVSVCSKRAAALVQRLVPAAATGAGPVLVRGLRPTGWRIGEHRRVKVQVARAIRWLGGGECRDRAERSQPSGEDGPYPDPANRPGFLSASLSVLPQGYLLRQECPPHPESPASGRSGPSSELPD